MNRIYCFIIYHHFPNKLLKYSNVDFYSNLSTINYTIKFLYQYKNKLFRPSDLIIHEGWIHHIHKKIKYEEKCPIWKKHDLLRIDANYHGKRQISNFLNNSFFSSRKNIFSLSVVMHCKIGLFLSRCLQELMYITGFRVSESVHRNTISCNPRRWVWNLGIERSLL